MLGPTAESAERTDLQAGNTGYARYVLGVLLVAYAFNFIDRIILGILVPPIKAEIHLTDAQLGILGGTAFALFYTFLGIPIGWLADRVNRVSIMAISLALWSAFSAATGFAHGFWQLFVARLGVGVGEAGGVAPAYSLISDYFPPERRGRALAVYSFGIPIGSALAILFGGLVASSVNWRAAFFVVGGLGLLFAPVVGLGIREPVRGRLDLNADSRSPSKLSAVAAVLLPKISFWVLSLAGATTSIIGYGIFFWLPSLFVRSYHLSLRQVSWYLGAMTLVGGLAGMWLGGAIADRLGAERRSVYALAPAVACLVTAPCYAIGVLMPPSPWTLLLFVVPTALALAWLAPTITAIQHLVPPNVRALASALFLFINNLIGLGLGSWLLGHLSDRLTARYGAEALRYAILSGTSLYLVGAGLFLLAARFLQREWHHPAPIAVRRNAIQTRDI